MCRLSPGYGTFLALLPRIPKSHLRFRAFSLAPAAALDIPMGCLLPGLSVPSSCSHPPEFPKRSLWLLLFLVLLPEVVAAAAVVVFVLSGGWWTGQCDYGACEFNPLLGDSLNFLPLFLGLGFLSPCSCVFDFPAHGGRVRVACPPSWGMEIQLPVAYLCGSKPGPGTCAFLPLCPWTFKCPQRSRRRMFLSVLSEGSVVPTYRLSSV